MTAYLLDLLNMILRWAHLITGIAWIGSSFYFVWLDNSLEAPSADNRDKGFGGQLSSIHAGGFYEVAKYTLAPQVMPAHLHWFKWEAYTTWITGFFLFVLMFYAGASSYLIDAGKIALPVWQAILISLAAIIGSWLLYDALCKSPLARNPWLLAAILLAYIGAMAFALGEVFSDRAAYMHIGVIIGSTMVANVFFVIMPGQRALVAAVEAGQQPDPVYARNSKLRSVHNNYLTLPVLFLMISNHYPVTYGHDHAWAVLLAIIVITAWTRHFFNLRHKGVVKPQILVSSAIAFALLAWWLAPRLPTGLAGTVDTPEAFAIVQARCNTCHSANPTDEIFTIAPAGVIMDTEAQLLQWAPRIVARSVVSKDMPLLNKTQMTDEEREKLAVWAAQL